MSVQVKLKKGADIKLKGVATRIKVDAKPSEVLAIKPSDFHGVIPKLILREGAKVKAGTPIFFDKENEKIKFSSPVSGEIVEIVRGARRVILEIKIKSDGSNSFEDFGITDIETASVEELKGKLLNSGLWPFIKQRPFNCIANPEDQPKAVFVSAFDTHPLAPDYDFILEGREEDFQLGIDALAKFSKTGFVNLNIPADKKLRFNAEDKFSYTDDVGREIDIDYKTASNFAASHGAAKALRLLEKKYGRVSDLFSKANNVALGEISGQHPAGNVGIQIHHINPINKGEVVWTVNAQDVAMFGEFLRTGNLNARKVIALTGSEVTFPQYYNVTLGQNLEFLLDGNLIESEERPRFISGNPLTGTKVEINGYLGAYDSQITVLPEGDSYDLFGWALPIQPNKFSLSRTLWSWIMPSKAYRLNTNMNGEQRAFVVTGEYERLLPMSIYPVQLLKSCLVEDIDAMEGLGIYEIIPEDLALCEFACTSKQPVQEILQTGLDLVKKECA
ncbi:MAG: NADH:ubiquinone reductase (Na(+)-transporting) subunit A [Flavobacteriales bacterium]|nr:NADH:ubiquinone reductase (Na(+)-transporting) subunit A [Flavobacteriales bacterium]